MNYTSKDAERVIKNLRLDGQTEEMPVVIALLNQLAAILKSREDAKAVAIVENMPGTSGFTMAVFSAEAVPRGTKIFTRPPAESGDAKDAARYRWLRDTADRDDDEGSPYIALDVTDTWGNWKTHWQYAEKADQLIDAAMTAESREN